VKIEQELKKAMQKFLDAGYAEASSICNAIQQFEPMWAPNLHLLSLITYKLGDFNRAIELAETCVGIETNNVNYLISLTDMYKAQGRHQDAIPVISKVSESIKNSGFNQDQKTEMIQSLLNRLKNAPADYSIPNWLSLLDYNKLEHWTIVTCHGWSGSNWMATALNKHPDIIATHSARNLLSTGDVQELKGTVIERNKARQARASQNAIDILEGIKKFGESKVYACVHTLRARDLERYLSKFPGNTTLNIANQLRHPLSVIASGVGQLRELIEYDVFTMNEVINTSCSFSEVYYQICDRHKIEYGNWDVLTAFDACSHLRYLKQDIPFASKLLNLQMEKLVSDKDYFHKAVKKIAPNIEIDNEYLETVFKIGKVNPHHQNKVRLTPAEQWENWPSWMKEMFLFFFNQTGIEEFYISHGYDFSFLQKNS